MTRQMDFVTDVEAFLRESGMAPSRFGREVSGCGRFVPRIRAGGGVTLETADRAARIMAAWRAEHARPF